MKDIQKYLEEAVHRQMVRVSGEVAKVPAMCVRKSPQKNIEYAVSSALQDFYHRRCGLTNVSPPEEVIERLAREVTDALTEKTRKQLADTIAASAFNPEK